MSNQVSEDQINIKEEITGKQIAMVSPATRPFALSEELVTFPPNSCGPVQHVEDKPTTSVKPCQYQQFFEMLASKGISTETLMELIQTSAGCIPLLLCCINELLSCIIIVTDDAEKVLTIENTYSMLPVFIEQALTMLEKTPIQVTEIDPEDDALVTSMLTTLDSHMCTKSLRHIPSLETPTLHDHSKVPVDQPNDEFEVTCHPVQDTDNDEDSDNVELLTFECYRSASAYCNNEVTEIFELL